MAHHGSKPDESLLRALFAEREHLGATGQFPEGRLTATDEGEIRMAVGVKDGKVVLNFGTPVVWFGMTRTQARDLGVLLVARSQEIPE